MEGCSAAADLEAVTLEEDLRRFVLNLMIKFSECLDRQVGFPKRPGTLESEQEQGRYGDFGVKGYYCRQNSRVNFDEGLLADRSESEVEIFGAWRSSSWLFEDTKHT